MFCKKCGKEVQSDWTVCPNCGEEIAGAKGSEKEPKEIIQNVNSETGKKKASKKKKMIGLIVIVVIVIAGISTCGGSETNESEGTGREESVEDMGNETNISEIETDNEEDSDELEAENEVTVEDLDYTVAELYTLLQDNEAASYVLNENASKFLAEHEDYFPTTNYEHIAKAVDTSIEYRHIEKNAGKYGDKLMEIPELYVGTIEEEEIGESTLTTIQAGDVEGNVYFILYNDSLEDVFKDDIIKANVLPFGVTSYDNVSGGTTKALIGAGSYIEKIE